MKQITFEKAHVKGVRFKIGNQAVVGFVEMVGKLTPAIAEVLGVKWSCYDKDSLPKSGYTKIELDTELTQCKVHLEVTGAANFILDLTSPTINKFVVVRVGGKKKARSTYLAVKFLCGVVGREQELIAFLKTAGMADGRLVIDERAPEQTTLAGVADGAAIEKAVAKAAGKAKGKAAEPAPEPGNLIVHDSKLVNLSIALQEDDGAWYSEVAVLLGTPPKSVTTKLSSAMDASSRPAALVEALERVAIWTREQDRKSMFRPVVDGAKELLRWYADRKAEINAALDMEQALTPPGREALIAPITFAERMRLAKTADEGRDIIKAHETAIHDLQVQYEVAPTCGRMPNGYTGFSVVTPKEWKAAVKDLRAEDTLAASMLEDLIREGNAMELPWRALHLAELHNGCGRLPAGDDAIPDGPIPEGEAVRPLRVLRFDRPTHRAIIRVGPVLEGSNAIDYEVSAVANAKESEPIVFSCTSHDVAFETLEQAQLAAAKELMAWALRLVEDSPAKSPLRAQGLAIAAWAQAQFNQVQEMQEAVSA